MHIFSLIPIIFPFHLQFNANLLISRCVVSILECSHVRHTLFRCDIYSNFTLKRLLFVSSIHIQYVLCYKFVLANSQGLRWGRSGIGWFSYARQRNINENHPPLPGYRHCLFSLDIHCCWSAGFFAHIFCYVWIFGTHSCALALKALYHYFRCATTTTQCFAQYVWYD